MPSIALRAALSALMLAAILAPQADAARRDRLQWYQGQNGQGVPRNAVFGGNDSDGGPLYICRVQHKNGVHPGKLRRGKCHFPYDKKELTSDYYDVLVGRAVWDRPGSGGVVGGYEANGTPLVICRGFEGNSEQPGKVVRDRCNYAYGGKERNTRDYEVLYED